MTAPRMKWLLLAFGIVFLSWTTLAVQRQVKNVDDKSLKDAGKGTEWLSNGMNWAEQRYSTMAQITPENVGKLERGVSDISARGFRARSSTYGPVNTL